MIYHYGLESLIQIVHKINLCDSILPIKDHIVYEDDGYPSIKASLMLLIQSLMNNIFCEIGVIGKSTNSFRSNESLDNSQIKILEDYDNEKLITRITDCFLPELIKLGNLWRKNYQKGFFSIPSITTF